MMGNDNVTAYQYMSQYKFIDLNNTSSMCFGDEVVKQFMNHVQPTL